jgi:hypothetical protein
MSPTGSGPETAARVLPTLSSDRCGPASPATGCGARDSGGSVAPAGAGTAATGTSVGRFIALPRSGSTSADGGQIRAASGSGKRRGGAVGNRRLSGRGAGTESSSDAPVGLLRSGTATACRAAAAGKVAIGPVSSTPATPSARGRSAAAAGRAAAMGGASVGCGGSGTGTATNPKTQTLLCGIAIMAGSATSAGSSASALGGSISAAKSGGGSRPATVTTSACTGPPGPGAKAPAVAAGSGAAGSAASF